MANDPNDYHDVLPDVRDGLTRTERVILYCLKQAQEELGGRNVPSTMLYGRVVEHINLDPNTFNALITKLIKT